MRNVTLLTPLFLALAVGGTAWGGPLAAQTAAGDDAPTDLNLSTLNELDDDREDIRWQGVSLDRLEDMNVFSTAGEEIGDVEDILGDAQENVVAFVVESGGFLDIGDEEIVVPVEHVRLDADRSALVVDLSADAMKQLETWED